MGPSTFDYTVTSFYEQSAHTLQVGGVPSSVEEAVGVLNTYDLTKKRALYQALIIDCLANTPGRKQDETWKHFIHRRCQRNPDLNMASSRTKARLANRKLNRKKTSKKKPSKEEILKRDRLHKEKWCNEKVQEANPDEVEDDNNASNWVELDEEFATAETVDDFLRLLKEDGIDVENDAMLHNLLEDKERISLKRQLGSWIEVEVDSENKRVTCNCEDYNFHYTCIHQATFEVLQFGMLPNKDCSLTVEKWKEIGKTCVRFLKKHYLENEN